MHHPDQDELDSHLLQLAISAQQHPPRSPGPQIALTKLEAYMISQILSTVLDSRPLLWWWSGWIEALWIWGWSLVGGSIAWRCSKPLYLGLAMATALLTLFGICFDVFTQAGWIPFVPPVLILVLTATAVTWTLRRKNSASYHF